MALRDFCGQVLPLSISLESVTFVATIISQTRLPCWGSDCCRTGCRLHNASSKVSRPDKSQVLSNVGGEVAGLSMHFPL